MSDITADDIQDAEKQIAGMKQLAERRELALKLSQNPEFRKLILEYYLVEETARLVHLSADPSLSEQDQRISLSMAQAAGHFKRFMSATMQMGFVAQRDLAQHVENLEQMRIEFSEQE